MTKRLIVSAHDAKWHFCFAVFGDHAGNNRVKGTLIWRDAVSMSWFDNEPLSPIGESNAGLRCHNTSAKIMEQRIYKRTCVPVFVDDRDVDRVLVFRQ